MAGSHAKPAKSKASELSRVHEGVQRVRETLGAAGVEVAGLSGFMYFWKRLGLKGTLLLVLICGFPLGEYSVLRSAVHYAVPRTVGGFGLDFEAESWTLSPLSLKATARNVRLREHSEDKPVLTASEIEFKGSAWTILRSFPDMITFHIFGGRQPFHEVVIRHGELNMERSLSGHMNWEDFVAAVPQARIEEALAGVYPVEMLRCEDCRVTYLENIPGGSGDGIIKTAQAQVKVDEIKATFANLMQPRKTGETPTSFKIQGRSADGIFEITGAGALFPALDKPAIPFPLPDPSPDRQPEMKTISFNTSAVAGGDLPFEISIYLENIAAAAFGRMVPNTTLIPVNGTIGGNVKVIRTAAKARCEGGFTLKNVHLAANPDVLTDPGELNVVQRSIVNVAYNGRYDVCHADETPTSADGGGDKIVPIPSAPAVTEPPVSMALARLTTQATAKSSPAVQALVERDRQTLRGEKPKATVADLTDNVAKELGVRISHKSASHSTTDGNGVSKAFKEVGLGFKGLFGGGKKATK